MLSLNASTVMNILVQKRTDIMMKYPDMSTKASIVMAVIEIRKK